MADASEPEVTTLQLSFQTANPYDLIPRAFDHARKSNIVLEEITSKRVGAEGYEVEACFSAPDATTLDTFRARCAALQSGDLDG